MKTKRLTLAAIVAITLAVVIAVQLAPSYCFPGCGGYNPWDIEYYIFQCWQCPPNPPEG